DPQLVGAGRGEVAFHEIGGADDGRISVGGEPLLLPARPTDAIDAHQAGYLVAADVEPGLAGRLGQLASPVHRVVLRPEGFEDRAQLGVTTRSGARWPGLR